MKTKLLLTALCLGASLSAPAMAVENPLYIGLTAGKMMVDLDGLDDANSTGILMGYRFTDELAVEGGFTKSSSANFTVQGVSGTWDVDVFAVYMAYRTPGDVYFKGKIGVLNEDVSVSSGSVSLAGSDTGGSLGVGGGVKFGKTGALELEYTLIEENINFLSLGVNFRF
jgi:hypothetical protein